MVAFLERIGIGRKDTIERYEGVLVPLANAQRHPTVAAEYARRLSQEQNLDRDAPSSGAGKKEGDLEGSEGVFSQQAMFTIEGLREEVKHDISASGASTSYDLKSKVINKAIQDIGMGRYNWELFILCGFGWFADK
jgi:hypothetical protein